MTFDQFANQGGTAAWDPEEAAATKKAADKLFGEADDSIEVDDVVSPGADATTAPGGEGKVVGTDGDEDTPKQDPNQPGEVPDPDITLEP